MTFRFAEFVKINTVNSRLFEVAFGSTAGSHPYGFGSELSQVLSERDPDEWLHEDRNDPLLELYRKYRFNKWLSVPAMRRRWHRRHQIKREKNRNIPIPAPDSGYKVIVPAGGYTDEQIARGEIVVVPKRAYLEPRFVPVKLGSVKTSVTTVVWGSKDLTSSHKKGEEGKRRFKPMDLSEKEDDEEEDEEEEGNIEKAAVDLEEREWSIGLTIRNDLLQEKPEMSEEEKRVAREEAEVALAAKAELLKTRYNREACIRNADQVLEVTYTNQTGFRPGDFKQSNTKPITPKAALTTEKSQSRHGLVTTYVATFPLTKQSQSRLFGGGLALLREYQKKKAGYWNLMVDNKTNTLVLKTNSQAARGKFVSDFIGDERLFGTVFIGTTTLSDSQMTLLFANRSEVLKNYQRRFRSLTIDINTRAKTLRFSGTCIRTCKSFISKITNDSKFLFITAVLPLTRDQKAVLSENGRQYMNELKEMGSVDLISTPNGTGGYNCSLNIIGSHRDEIDEIVAKASSFIQPRTTMTRFAHRFIHTEFAKNIVEGILQTFGATIKKVPVYKRNRTPTRGPQPTLNVIAADTYENAVDCNEAIMRIVGNDVAKYAEEQRKKRQVSIDMKSLPSAPANMGQIDKDRHGAIMSGESRTYWRYALDEKGGFATDEEGNRIKEQVVKCHLTKYPKWVNRKEKRERARIHFRKLNAREKATFSVSNHVRMAFMSEKEHQEAKRFASIALKKNRMLNEVIEALKSQGFEGHTLRQQIEKFHDDHDALCAVFSERRQEQERMRSKREAISAARQRYFESLETRSGKESVEIDDILGAFAPKFEDEEEEDE